MIDEAKSHRPLWEMDSKALISVAVGGQMTSVVDEGGFLKTPFRFRGDSDNYYKPHVVWMRLAWRFTLPMTVLQKESVLVLSV